MTAVMAGVIEAPAPPDITEPRSARLKPRMDGLGQFFGLCEDCYWDTRTTMNDGRFSTAGGVSPIAGHHGGIDPRPDVPLCPEAVRRAT